MRLAEHLGFEHGDVILSRLSPAQLSDWVAYEAKYGPIGQHRNDIYRAADICVFVNAHKGEDDFPADLEDFMFFREIELTDSDIDAKLGLLFPNSPT